MDTRPPIFKEATEPLDAEEWINTMEDKFRVLRMTVMKIEYAAHQLQGPAGMWWKHHRTTFPPVPTSLGGRSLKLFVECTFQLV
jgi:hypothetical protein